MTVSRIGLFGGTFDPPHLGHLILAAEAQAQLGLTRLLWVLTAQPPHKPGQPVTALEHRLSMLELAITDDPYSEISRIEIDRPGPHYAADTLRLMQARDPETELVYLIGGDSLRDLPNWQRPSDLLAGCRFLGVMRRPGDSVDLSALERLLPGIQAKVRFVDAPLLEISSREIRRRVAEGGHFRYYLPDPVYKYIVRQNLYR
ncbi:MAG: nicotinate-nucleotide adenylyltransferase [Chloroflexota bacterium]